MLTVPTAIEDGDSLELKFGTKVVSASIIVSGLDDVETKSTTVEETDASVELLVDGNSVTIIGLSVTVVCCCDSLRVDDQVVAVASDVDPEVNVGSKVLGIDVIGLLLLVGTVSVVKTCSVDVISIEKVLLPVI